MKRSILLRNTGKAAGASLVLLGLLADAIGIGLGNGLGHIQLISIVLGASILFQVT